MPRFCLLRLHVQNILCNGPWWSIGQKTEQETACHVVTLSLEADEDGGSFFKAQDATRQLAVLPPGSLRGKPGTWTKSRKMLCSYKQQNKSVGSWA